jgi:uncharacterized RDD family membrane protein YckC
VVETDPVIGQDADEAQPPRGVSRAAGPVPPGEGGRGGSGNSDRPLDSDRPADGNRSLAERLISRGANNAQRLIESSGLDEAIENAVAEAIVSALESEATERAVAQILNGPLIEQAVGEALRSPAVEAAIIEVLDSGTVTRVWDHVLDGPQTQRLIERVAESPEVRGAITAQGIGLIGDLGHQVSKVTRVLDFFGERVSRRVLLRRRRAEPTDRAGFFTRALGVGIDAVIVNFSLVALGAVISAFADALGILSGDVAPSVFAVGALLWFLFSSLYLLVFWSASGQTPGMRFLDIRIEKDGEHRIGARAAFRRLVGFWLSAAIFGLGFIGVLIRIDRRGFHDRLGGTAVYFIDPSSPDESHERPVL